MVGPSHVRGTRRRRHTLTIILLAGLVVAAAACAASPAASATAPPGKGWVGQVSGTRAYVGVVVRGAAVTAYVCDGRRVGRWYTGALKGRGATLRDDRGRRLVLALSGRNAGGRVNLPGRRRARFVAVPARGRAGVFRRVRAGAGRPRNIVEGWVRLNDGRLKGLARSQEFKVRRPQPGIEVFLRPDFLASDVGPPAGGPPLSARLVAGQAGPCFTLPRSVVRGRTPEPFRSGPSCGLPAAGMKIGVRRGSTRVRIGKGLAESAIDRLRIELPLLGERERARLLRAAGLPSGPEEPLERGAKDRLDRLAEAMVTDRELTAAAAALRSPGSPEKLAKRGELYRLLGEKYFDPELKRLVDRPEIAILDTSATRIFPVTFEQHIDGENADGTEAGWTVFDFRELEGPDAEINGPPPCGAFGFACVPGAPDFNVLGHFDGLQFTARAGFYSRAEMEIYAAIDIDVPAGMREVEVETLADDSAFLDSKLGCLGGVGQANADWLIALYAMNADGSFHVFDDPAVEDYVSYRRYQEGDLFGLPPGPLKDCGFVPPLPPPPSFPNVPGASVLPKLYIRDPPAAGGRFLLIVGALGTAQTFSDGQAWVNYELLIDEVIVRARS